MSKAFTKEDDGEGLEPVVSSRALPRSAFRLTRAGAQKLAADDDPRLHEALKLAEVVDVTEPTPPRAALGVSVVVEDEHGERHSYRLVSVEERALLGEGCSVDSPIGRALLGGQKGEVREARVPRGTTELEILELKGDGREES